MIKELEKQGISYAAVKSSIYNVIQEYIVRSLQEFVPHVKKDFIRFIREEDYSNANQETGKSEEDVITNALTEEENALTEEGNALTIDLEKRNAQRIENNDSIYVADIDQPLACYVYGIIRSKTTISLGPVGVDSAQVYTVSGPKDLCALVHNCLPEAYVSEDDELVKRWLFAHQNVLDQAYENCGTVLPMGFNNIVFVEGKDPHEIIKNWLTQEENLFTSLYYPIIGK